jgi:hypothetical protein
MTPPSVAREILELVRLATDLGSADDDTPIRVRNFRHVANGQGQVVLGTGAQRLSLFEVPQNAAFVVTFVSIRAFFTNVVGDREPWPFFELDQRGLGTLRVRVNGSYISRADSNYSLIANNPCLMVFDPGDLFELIVNRSANGADLVAGYPAVVNIATRVNGYLVTPAAIAQRFTAIETQLITKPVTVNIL